MYMYSSCMGVRNSHADPSSLPEPLGCLLRHVTRTMTSLNECKPRGAVFTYIHSELNYIVGQLVEVRIELL